VGNHPTVRVIVFTAHQLRPLLEALSQSDVVIVGGQAINLWSEIYQKDDEPWRSLRPFTSRDLDALGSATALLECARRTYGQALFPHAGQKTVNTGKLTVIIGGRPVEADFLSEVKGLNNQEIRQTAKLARPCGERRGGGAGRANANLLAAEFSACPGTNHEPVERGGADAAHHQPRHRIRCRAASELQPDSRRSRRHDR